MKKRHPREQLIWPTGRQSVPQAIEATHGPLEGPTSWRKSEAMQARPGSALALGWQRTGPAQARTQPMSAGTQAHLGITIHGGPHSIMVHR